MDSPSPGQRALVPGLPERIGPFLITGILGRGATGVVFDALAPEGQRIALKVIRPTGEPDRVRQTVARFLREAKILEQIDHPGVVQLFSSGNEDGLLYLAMARVEGVSLLSLRRQGPLGFDALLQLGARVADALEHLHRAGVVHRDIKPANILIDERGRPVITDFGISGFSDATGITRQGDLLGSPGFMAPEVIEGATPDARADLFGLGRLLFELGAVGEAKKLPKGAPILEVLAVAMEIEWHRFPIAMPWPPLLAVIRRLLAQKPEDRYPTAAEARDELLSLGTGGLLDVDTLNEHVGKLSLKKRTTWEALADDLDLGAPSGDELLADLDLPAGEQRALARFDTMKVIAPEDQSTGPPYAPAIPGLVTMTPDPDSDDHTEPPGALEPGLLAPKVRTPSFTRNLTSSPRVPVEDPAGRTEIDLPPPIEALIPKLERQIARQKEEIVALKKTAYAPRPKSPLYAAAAVALIFGALSGFAVAKLLGASPGMVLVAAPSTNPEGPRILPSGKVPTERDRADAQGMLEAGRERVRSRQLDEAERLFALCVELAELPACHRELGSLLSLYGDPLGPTHLRRYLELAPGASDAAAVKRALDSN
jgi:serine/threonine protein kinase